MTKRKKSLIWVILIVFISIGSFGFSNFPDPILQDENTNDIDGWIDIFISASLFYHGVGFNAGTYAGDLTWLSAQAMLPITIQPGNDLWRVHGTTAYSSATNVGYITGETGTATHYNFHPVHWSVKAVLYPDCSVGIDLLVMNYPGVGIGCSPFGCVSDSIPAEFFIGPKVKIPPGQNLTVIPWEVGGNKGSLTILIRSLIFEYAGCESGTILP